MEIARLQIAVDAQQAKGAATELKKLGAESKRTEDAIRKTSSAVKSFVGALAIGATINKVIAATVEQERVTAQLEATLKSTGRYTPELSARLQAMAGDLQQVTTYGDESVIAMQSLLLTFTQIGGPEFDRAQMAILDVATAMGTDLKSAALQVGKALNDPILGVTALARSGIQFSESQKEVIKQLTETGRVAEAQGIILEELERQFGGSARAARNTLGGALQSLKNTFGDLLEGSGGNVTQTTDAINDLNKALSDPQIKAAFDTIVSGVLSITTAVANVLPELVAFTRWAGEELAVLVGGIGGHDIVRLEEQADKLTETLSKLQATGNTRFAAYASMSAELDELNKQIDHYYQNLEQAPAQKPPGGDSGVAALIAQTTGETKKLDGATKKLTEAQRAAIREQERMKAAVQSNADVITDLAEALYQATLPADALAKRQAELRLNQYATPEQIAQVNSLADALFRMEAKKAAGSNFEQAMSTLPGGESPELERLRLEYEQKQLIVAEAYQAEYLNKQMHDAAMIDLDRAYAMQRQQIMDESMARQQAQALQSAASIISITATQISTMQGLFDQGSAAGKAFFLFSQALAAANAVVQGFQSAMAIRVAYAQMAAMSGPAAPALLAAGEAHASVAMGMGFATAGMIAGQTIASFDGGGFTGTGSRSGGMDGKGGFMAMLHPNETVIDHTKGKSAGVGSTTNVINITVDTGGATTETGKAQSESVALAQSIRAVVVDEMERQNRQGGILWSMRNG